MLAKVQLSLPKKQKQSSLKPKLPRVLPLLRMLDLLRMPLLLKELPSKKSSAKKGDQLILVHSDTHAHVQNDIWVFDLIFHSNWTWHIFSSVDLTVASLTDLLNDLDIFRFDNEIQTLMLFQKFIELPDFLTLTLLGGFLSFYHF